ncbi:hypothetical protein RIF23_00515 [Lipingzhangella sp. LS1_29]|uniref:Uncharacterized protein n=1 Tax=Lipingzhangella rawalii TaxID=2055835 RepID=A0ABU2H0D8_9ACTN|nr:hypothetical protein [Lipingzhangella rawalii]MDS1268771.1 hypothetical protein [Lipingzhangella rawalii]
MNPVSPICLADLAPALRWSKPEPVTTESYLGHHRLGDAWWHTLPLARVLEIAGSTWLAANLARLAVEQWEHLSLREALPSLHSTPVDINEIGEPVRSAILRTAGDWDTLVDTPLTTLRAWSLPPSCGVVDVVSTVMLRVVQPFGTPGTGGTVPSPALMQEALRTVSGWVPTEAPQHVHDALNYLTDAVGSPPASEAPPPSSRAIRTLRALRNQRDEEPRTARPERSSALRGPDGSLRRPAFSPARPGGSSPEQPHPTPDVSAPYAGAAPPAEHPLVDRVDSVVRSWSAPQRLLASQRLFAAEPVSIRDLAHQYSLDVAQLRSAQRDVEDRLLRWLSSPEGAPLATHLRTVDEQLGVATTVDQLVAAHSEHTVEVPALGVPLWRVLLVLFTDRRAQDGWLITGDPGQLRWQTRQLLAGQPSMAEATMRLTQLGIRHPVAHAWIASTPGVSIRDDYVHLDSPPTAEPSPDGRTVPPVAAPAATPEPRSPTTSNGLPIRRRTEGRSQQPARVSTSAQCFRAPDGRWWHRVDVTADQLNGAPVGVPQGYAAHLGLGPGQLLCLTGPGADLIVLVWRDAPAFDSLRPLLRRLDARPGDHVFLTVDGDRLDARRLAAADVPEHPPTSRALHLIGYTAPASTEEALEIILRRISETDQTGPVEVNRVLELLERRGDSDIAGELRPALYATR